MSKHRRAIRLTAKERRRVKPISPAYTFSYSPTWVNLPSVAPFSYNDPPIWSTDPLPVFTVETGTTAANTTNLNPSHYTIQYNGNSYTLSLDPNTNNLAY
jgi:hypothetical protein